MAQGITSNFGQILEAGQNARYDRQVQRDIAEMKYGNRGGGSGGGSDLDWAKFGLEMAAQKQKMQAMQQEMDKRAIQDLKDAKMRIALLNHQKAKSKNPKEIEAYNRQIQAERKAMYAIYAPGEEDYESMAIGDAVKQSTGISNPMPFAGSAHPSLTEQATSGFGQWASQNGLIKINPKTRAEVEKEQAMAGAEEIDMGTQLQNQLADTTIDAPQEGRQKDSGLIPWIKDTMQQRKTNKAEYAKYKEDYANSGMTTVDGKSGPQSYRQWLKNGKGQPGISSGDIPQEEGNALTTQYGQPVKTAEQADPIEVFEEDIENAIRTGDMSQLPPDVAAHLGAYLSNVEMGQTADGNMAIVDHNTIMDLLGADETAKLNEQDYRMQQYMPQQAQQMQQDEADAMDANILLNHTLEGKEYMNAVGAQDNLALAQGNARKVLTQQGKFLDKNPNLGSLGTYNALNVQQFDSKSGTMGGGSHQQAQVLSGGGGGSSNKENFNMHAVVTQAGEDGIQYDANGRGMVGKTPVDQSMNYQQKIDALIKNNDMGGLREYLQKISNTKMSNPKTGKTERIIDIAMASGKGIDRKDMGTMTALSNTINSSANPTDAARQWARDLTAYMPEGWFGSQASEAAKMEVLQQALEQQNRINFRANGAVYTGTRNELKGLKYKNPAYIMEVQAAYQTRSLEALHNSIFQATEPADKIVLAQKYEELYSNIQYTKAMANVTRALDGVIDKVMPTKGGLIAEGTPDGHIQIGIEHPTISKIVQRADGKYQIINKNGNSANESFEIDKLEQVVKRGL